MTKKIILSILLVCFVLVLKTYAAPPSIFYVANKDTCLYRNHGGDYIGDIQKGQKLQYVHDKNFGFADDYVEVETEDSDRGYISIDDIEIQGSLSTKECFEGNWIAKYCLDSLYKSDISIFFDYEGNIIDYFNEEYKDTDHGLEDNYSSWHELIGVGYIHFNNCCFYIGTVHGTFDALILNIDDKAITFYSIYVDKRRTGRFYDRLERDTIYVMDYKIDGDYLNLYIDNQLFMTYVNLDKRTELEISKFLKEENYNIKNVTWPRHADGTCDYDDIATAASETQDIEKSADAPATEECKESVEETAFSEIVESEISDEETESVDITDTDAKQNATLPILPIVASVAVLAVLLVVILLAVKKRKVGKE